MNLKKVSVKPFYAKVTLGLEKGYTQKLIDKSELTKSIQLFQNQLIKDKNIILSISLNHCDIILSGQVEPHLNLNFINYPKFPLEEKKIKTEIENLTQYLMKKFEQNRVVIEYIDETVMFENSELIDPRIKIKN